MSGLTEAQLVLCRNQLQATKCPVCEAKKRPFRCFCAACYFALTEELRASLWVPRMDTQSLLEWSERYTAAKEWLRREVREE